MVNIIKRLPHADMDMRLRMLKARKVEELLAIEPSPATRTLLEVGTGSGGIAHYFSRSAKSPWMVTAVDVVDNRQLRDGYNFQQIEGCVLPFADDSFDVVISNHVIEHVGLARSQLLHLTEIKRVLRPGGRAYLAVPSRWMIVEPHYKLPFLSWLPRYLRTPYLKFFKRGAVYDCEPLSRKELERLLKRADFTHENLCAQALSAVASIEKRSTMGLIIKMLPLRILKGLSPVVPTHIYRLTK